METTFKLRISKLIQSSLNSCRTKPISDVADQPFFFPENRHHHRHLIDLFSPKPIPLQSTQKPHISQPKFTQDNTLFPTVTKSNSKKPKTSKKKKPRHRKTIKIQDFSSVTDNYYYDCFSSDEDNEIDDDSHESHETTTLFSSRSFSSESSVSFRKNRASRRRCNTTGGGQIGGGCKDRRAIDVIPIKGVGRIGRDSVAVVKKSSDPHEDFRVSMLEMIVERQILGVKELENLLQCFLSLNSEEHHRVICEVYVEIWETLFSDWV